ncbi:unnamed protein product [Didymodactylos carnosus]|uniref:DUF4201 domain-containing protein n=1 Tax=Didymodactylos carnosus TaxID=1234261 RepID=A0A814W822_9BILA|nr:unnamed protein product [Didymodactylos carnosus]CAF3963239.1 unnamed protein product [Didymodactylos carnosus]
MSKRRLYSEPALQVPSMRERRIISLFIPKDFSYEDTDDDDLMRLLEDTVKENQTLLQENLLYHQFLARVGHLHRKLDNNDTFEEEEEIHANPPLLLSISVTEQMRIAEYECDQSRRDVEKKMLYHLWSIDEMMYLDKLFDGDINSQIAMIREVEKRVNLYKLRMGEPGFNPNFKFSGELVLDQIKKRIHSLISLIGRFKINSAGIKHRIKSTDERIRLVDKLRETTDDVDVQMAHKKKLDFKNKADNLHRKLIVSKAHVFLRVRCLQKARENLESETLLLEEIKEKWSKNDKLIKMYKTEIDQITRESIDVQQENDSLRRNLSEIKISSSIMNYVKLVQHLKEIKHEADIYTKRVQIGEVSRTIQK